MLFNSYHFVVFFAVFFLLYYQCSYKFRRYLILIASYYFYMSWNAKYSLLLMTSTLIDYFAAIYMSQLTLKSKGRKSLLILSLFSNLGILFCFKYFNFVSNLVADFSNLFLIDFNSPTLDVLLPVGISFYTFQTLSYTIDVYRGKTKPTRNFIEFASYVSFFPQLVAGPIERAQSLLPQFSKKIQFDYENVVQGFRLMLWGFFKKIVVADRLAEIVNPVFASPESHNSLTLLLAIHFFAFQIYCDFSGYSDIAIGCARSLGFKLMTNFRTPYFSVNIKEFWARWHISLTSWFRDYLYIPLGGNRKGPKRTYINILSVFVISGLWHGANTTFFLWGLLHGFVSIIESLWVRFRLANPLNLLPSKLSLVAKILVTYHIVLIAWVFFRANTASDAYYILNKIMILSNFFDFNISHKIPIQELALSSVILFIFLILDYFLDFKKKLEDMNKWPTVSRWSFYYGMTIFILFFGNFKKIEFIYFQF